MTLTKQVINTTLVVAIAYSGVKAVDWIIPWRPGQVFICIENADNSHDCNEYKRGN